MVGSLCVHLRTWDPDYVYSLIRTVCEAITNTRIEDLKKPDGSFKPMNEWPAGAFRAVRGITMNPGTNRVIDVELEDQEAARRDAGAPRSQTRNPLGRRKNEVPRVLLDWSRRRNGSLRCIQR